MPDVFWAAFGGAAAAGLMTLLAVIIAEWFRWFLDRPLVRCELATGFVLHPLIQDRTQYIYYSAANPHSKVVTLAEFGLIYKRKEWGKLAEVPQTGYDLPYQLEGGKSFTYRKPLQQLLDYLRQKGQVPDDLKWVYFRASSGKTYRSKISKGLIEEFQRKFNEMKES